MREVEQIIPNVIEILNQKMAQLEDLEKEKAEIMKKYVAAQPQERKVIEKEMRESESRFKSLLAEMNKLAKKVDSIKKKI